MHGQLDILRRHGTFRRLSKGEVLYRQGDKVTGWWLVQRGQVLEFVVDAAGREQITRVVPAGSPTGLCGLRMAPNYCGGACAGRKGAEVCFIDLDTCWAVLRANPDLACSLLIGLVEELRLVYQKLQDISTLPARATVASILLSTTECTPERQSQVTLTRAEIASMAGLAVETVVRILSEFRSQGLIHDNGYAHIQLLNPCGLHRASLALDEQPPTATGKDSFG